MKLLLFVFILLFSAYVEAQNICVDSSSHIRYLTQLNDSLRVQKTILTKDSGKIMVGCFLKSFTQFSGKSFLMRMDRRGEVTWFKKITSPFAHGLSEIQSIGEAENGNIFVAFNYSGGIRPFNYLVFSRDGTLVFQNCFGIANNEYASTNLPQTSMMTRFGPDSILVVLIHPVNAVTLDGMTLLTISNEGKIGQALSYAPPIVSSFNSYYSKCRVEGNDIFLYGSANFVNGCQLYYAQPVYSFLQINWRTKQVVAKKAYCSPRIGTGKFGDSLQEGQDSYNTTITLLDNGNTAFVRRIWGLDFNGGDTLCRIFKISTFDREFNHVGSEYICTREQFRWWEDWDYELYIDAGNVRHLFAHDFIRKQIYYGVSDSSGQFILQKKLPLSTNGRNRFQNMSQLREPGYFTSFNIVSSNTERSFIDNFRILEGDTAAPCFGTKIDYFETRPAVGSPLDWRGEFTHEQAVIESGPDYFTTEDYPLERVVICNLVHKCDTIHLTAPEKICKVDQPVLVTAFKDVSCAAGVNFSFDTTAVRSFTQVNDTSVSILFKHSGKFKVVGGLSTCSDVKDSVEIIVNAPLPPLSLGSDIVFCPGEQYRLSAFDPNFAGYRWQDGSADSIYFTDRPGTYTVTATDYCDRTYSDTIRILKKDFHLALGSDTTICKSESIVLSVPDGYENYIWAPQDDLKYIAANAVSVSPEANQSYSIMAEVFPGCQLSDTINIRVENCPQYIYFPDSFTPNNDGLNDVFKPVLGGALMKYELEVFNRWGQLVFKTNNKTEGWNGAYRGVLQSNGVFVWQCRYQFFGKPEQLKRGTLTIIR